MSQDRFFAALLIHRSIHKICNLILHGTQHSEVKKNIAKCLAVGNGFNTVGHKDKHFYL